MASDELLFGGLFDSCPVTWDLVPFEEAVDFQEGPGIMAVDFQTAGVPLIRLSGVQRSTVSLDGCNFLDPEKVAKKWNHFRLKRGDLLISSSASFGLVSEVGEDSEGSIAYTGLIRLRPRTDKVLPGFIKYFASSSFFKQQAEGMAVGSVLRHFGPSHLRKMAFPRPTLYEQDQIAKILSSLDDKIELNRRINATLEAMARALLKAWFVDFEPVHANIENRPSTSASPETSNLFPSAFQDSEIGMIPLDWTIRSMFETAKFVNGRAFKQQEFSSKGSGSPVIKIGELKTGVSQQTKFTESDFDAVYRIVNGDILFSWSGSPETSIDVFLWVGLEGWLNQHIFKVFPKRENDREFVYWLLREYKNEFVRIAKNKQTTGLGHVTIKDLQRLKFAFPPFSVIDAFHQLAAPMLALIVSNKKENFALGQLRDELLPRLISGKLSVKSRA